jgi:hypothetical protein
MIINVKNGKDLITLDFQLHQIRYCRNIAKHGKIKFINQDDLSMACYKFLYDDNRESFLSSLAEDMEGYVRKHVDPAKLQVITEQEYLEAVRA